MYLFAGLIKEFDSDSEENVIFYWLLLFVCEVE